VELAPSDGDCGSRLERGWTARLVPKRAQRNSAGEVAQHPVARGAESSRSDHAFPRARIHRSSEHGAGTQSLHRLAARCPLSHTAAILLDHQATRVQFGTADVTAPRSARTAARLHAGRTTPVMVGSLPGLTSAPRRSSPVSPGSNRRIGRVCVGLQLLHSPVPVFFGSPLLAPLKCPKMVGPLSDAPFLIGISAGIGHVFNLGCCDGPLPIEILTFRQSFTPQSPSRPA
jgi:hypothetical protein